MLNDNIILTTKDFTILEVLRDRHHDQTGLLLPLIRNKMERAIVVFREDLPGDIASINSRVRFRVAAGESDTRVISTGQTPGPVGMFLPITTLRGLALLGLREGQAVSLVNMNGVTEKIVLEKVEYQPEASRREREALGQEELMAGQKPMLRVISGGLDRRNRLVCMPANGSDDPGPSAA
ncbi:nucleoside-diphosphate kinase (plasmid) [Rhizobium sp. WL3]|uniref:nucleoside-diphosphate kinase n=1 Tax=Rhizobium sp. WL3 TaxID=2603277 RepID=UPI0011C209D8|nr:nucleoside-diphosphate kinase [Rhizobium sp. WL3]QEE43443.1 nucleoside-diphosphate kinase [Rhizobium sp. WL3]